MKISIIIPVYNVCELVANCLKSVFAQSYHNLEVIIVDDCSTDDSMSVVRNMIENPPLGIEVKIASHSVNRGLSEARNTGIMEASGEYLYFLDSDDEITPDCIQILVDATAGVLPDMIVGNYEVRNSDAYFPPLKLSSGTLYGHNDIIRAYMGEKIYVMAWNKLVRKDFLIKNRLFFKPGLLHEDCLWSFQCACLALSVSIVKHVTYIYKVRANSIKTATGAKKDVEALTDVLCEMVECISSYGLANNKYVHSFIEEEKLRLLQTCLDYGTKVNDLTAKLYTLFSSFPRPKLLRILCWSLLKTRKCMRDAHYFLPTFELRKTYYLCLPGFMSLRKKRWNKPFFYGWFIYILFTKILGYHKVKMLCLRN